MRISQLLNALGLSLFASMAAAVDGLVTLESPYSASDTMDRLEAVVEEKGLNVFARIDHAAGAATVGKSLRPTQLLIFGNPKGGTPFMECAQTVAIDLPLKALVWEDESHRVWLGYADPVYIAERHGVPDCPVPAVLRKVLAGFAATVVAQ